MSDLTSKKHMYCDITKRYKKLDIYTMFDKCYFATARFEKCEFTLVDYDKCTITGCCYTECGEDRTKFTSCKIRTSEFCGCRYWGIVFLGTEVCLRVVQFWTGQFVV